MAEYTKPPNTGAKLPCHWVEEDGFEVIPTQVPMDNLRTVTDSAFMLKPGTLPCPAPSPIA